MSSTLSKRPLAEDDEPQALDQEASNAQPSIKRTRTEDPMEDPTVFWSSAWKMLNALNETTVRTLLFQAMQSDGSALVLGTVKDAYNRHLQALELAAAKERARIIDFDSESKSVWYTLNKSWYTKLSGSKQYEASYGVFREVVETIASIGKRVKPEASFGTKVSALETIRKISKTVLMTGDCLGSEVRKNFQSETTICDTVIGILEGMSKEDRIRAGQNRLDEKGTLLEKMDWVASEGESYCIEGISGLAAAVELLEKGETDDEDPNDDDVNDDNEEDPDDNDGGYWSRGRGFEWTGSVDTEERY